MEKNKKKGRGGGAARNAPDSPVSPARPWLLSQQAGLKLLVFCAGAVLMGLEIAGSRVLAPHFGNSVFVWGSLISIFLIALTAGYYLGGRLADRHPSQRLLNSICIAVSLWIFALTALGHGICDAVWREGWGEQWGPLVASTLLFLPPSVGLGVVSPFSIRIAATSISSVGQVSGTLYALSTAGSIAGTLLTTFLLIPLIGVTAILRILGFVMLLAAVATFPISKDRFTRAALLAVSLIVLAGILIPGSQGIRLLAEEQMTHDEETPYHHISVIDNAREKSRELRFDKFKETAIKLAEPHETLEPYTNYFHLAFLVRPEMRRVLFIGAGGGVGPRTFAVHDGRLEIDVVDIDPKILEVAKKYFFLPDSPAINLIAQDGRMYVRQTSSRYDCILLDAFTIGGRIPFHLVTREFLELCREKLTEDGLFVMNLGSALEGPYSRIFRSMYRTAAAVFPNVYVFAQEHQARGKFLTTNIILLASKDAKRLPRGEWLDRGSKYESASYVNSTVMADLIQDLIEIPAPDETAPIFTDDYAPIETMRFF